MDGDGGGLWGDGMEGLGEIPILMKWDQSRRKTQLSLRWMWLRKEGHREQKMWGSSGNKEGSAMNGKLCGGWKGGGVPGKDVQGGLVSLESAPIHFQFGSRDDHRCYFCPAVCKVPWGPSWLKF